MRLEVAALLLDNDGVLVDSHRQVEDAWRALADEFGLDPDRVLAEVMGVRPLDSLPRLLPSDRVPAALRRIEELELASATGTVALPGAIELLAGLPAGSWTIVTSGSRQLAMARWRRAGIPIPPEPVTADDVARGKPDPEPYLLGAELLRVDPTECLVVEDSAPGARAGAGAGAHVVAIGDDPWDVEPIARIPDLTHLVVEVSDDRLLVEVG